MPFHAVIVGCASLADYLKSDLRSVVLWFRPKGGILVPGSPGLLQNPFQRRSLIRYPPSRLSVSDMDCTSPCRVCPGLVPAQNATVPMPPCPTFNHMPCELALRLLLSPKYGKLQFVEGLDTLHPLWYCRHLRPCLPPRRLLPLGCTLNLFNVRFPSGGAERRGPFLPY